MACEPVIAIIDVGKTNKKLFLFNESYKIVYERSARFLETTDEDGYPCENLESLKRSVLESVGEVLRKEGIALKALNFSTYGASFVNLDEKGEPVTPMYNYLKPYPEAIKQCFYQKYGDEESFALQTASPALGSLNSGLQLYRIKKEKPQDFQKIKLALHLPQYLSYLLSGMATTEKTSIGCHTALWDFEKNDYHQWVAEEELRQKFPAIHDSKEVFPAASGDSYKVGIGLHDSSAAIIPYLVSFKDPFVLISTGTWCISMNPFNYAPLTVDELKMDCLCYLQYNGAPVKASRLFAGNEHEEWVTRIAQHFNKSPLFYKGIKYDSTTADSMAPFESESFEYKTDIIYKSIFAQRDLSGFVSEKEAYHQLMKDIVTQQQFSTNLIMNGEVKRIFVDGGFSKNPLYMTMLAKAFPGKEVFAASMAQATALGAALAVHHSWNKEPEPSDLIELHYYNSI